MLDTAPELGYTPTKIDAGDIETYAYDRTHNSFYIFTHWNGGSIYEVRWDTASCSPIARRIGGPYAETNFDFCIEQDWTWRIGNILWRRPRKPVSEPVYKSVWEDNGRIYAIVFGLSSTEFERLT